jgi:hypothetical protein
MVASALRDLKSAGSASESTEAGPPLRSVARTLWEVVRLKNPLEPLFQGRAIALHFERTDQRDKLMGALLDERNREALEFCIDYLLGDREIVDAATRAISTASIRRTFVRELAVLLSGGEEKYIAFVSHYKESAEVLRAGGTTPDLAAAQKALSGKGLDPGDGITLLRVLAVSCPVSSLVCRPLLVPRQGYFLIPTVIGGKSALELLGIG